MTDSQRSDVIAEQHVREVAEQITAPREGECLLCYACRQVRDFGCDGTLRWGTRWHGAQHRRPRSFVKRLQRQGGYCDCQVLMDVFRHYPDDDVTPHVCH
ncbi:MAG: hypothetical protein DLM59_19925 [Pseudonocardiales bacterium]|nr:MAG: hypothetical protein DLM59_19925 [Pseudonocardiales bacterium]